MSQLPSHDDSARARANCWRTFSSGGLNETLALIYKTGALICDLGLTLGALKLAPLRWEFWFDWKVVVGKIPVVYLRIRKSKIAVTAF